MSILRSLRSRSALACIGLVLTAVSAPAILLLYSLRNGSSDADGALVALALIALAAAAVLGGLALRLSARTSRDVRSITEGAQQLSRGNLDHRVGAISSEETRELAQAFNGMAAFLGGLVRDLSGKRNELTAMLDTMADGVVVIDSSGRIAMINPAAELILDVGSKQAVGAMFADVVRDYELRDVVSRSSTIGRPQRSEVDLLQPPRLLSASATPVGDKERSVLLTLHDLTRVRQLDVTRREFVTNVSHELRNPLASMKASVETLEGGAVAEPRTAREFLQRIHREVDRMTYLVNDLLDLSRLESGHAPLNFSPVDLRPLVDEAVESVRDQAEGRGVSIGITMPAGLPMVLGEREMLGRVFVNLLDNALRASTAGGSVRVSAAVENGSVDVRVADTGTGIPREHLPHIFERFYKVDRSRRDGGTGLGLAIVKHIVQVHGGDVSAESREGTGTTLAFTVPRAT